MRNSTLFAFGLLVLACGGSGGATTDDPIDTTGNVDTSAGTGTVGTNTEGTSTGQPACTPGTEGCMCDAGACDGELSCFSNVCVMLPGPESTSGIETTGSSSGDGSSDEATETSSSSDSSSSTTEPVVETCEQEGNHVCQDSVVDTCVSGEVQSQACDEICAVSGLFTTGCADINGCGCDGFADATCIEITDKFCNCYSLFGNPCSDDFEENVYGYCFDPTMDEYSHEIVVCFGDFPTDTLEQCNAASDVCFNL